MINLLLDYIFFLYPHAYKIPKKLKTTSYVINQSLNFNFLYYKMGNVNQRPKGICLEIIFRNILLEEW